MSKTEYRVTLTPAIMDLHGNPITGRDQLDVHDVGSVSPLTYVVSVLALAVLGCGSDAAQATCGFRCGPAGACPADYSCHRDGRCHLDTAPLELSCALDAGIDADTQPQVIGTYPGTNQIGVLSDVKVRAFFDEPVMGISANSFFLQGRDELPRIPATVTYDPVEHVAWLDPVQPLARATIYRATLQGSITDAGYTAITPYALANHRQFPIPNHRLS